MAFGIDPLSLWRWASLNTFIWAYIGVLWLRALRQSIIGPKNEKRKTLERSETATEPDALFAFSHRSGSVMAGEDQILIRRFVCFFGVLKCRPLNYERLNMRPFNDRNLIVNREIKLFMHFGRAKEKTSGSTHLRFSSAKAPASAGVIVFCVENDFSPSANPQKRDKCYKLTRFSFELSAMSLSVLGCSRLGDALSSDRISLGLSPLIFVILSLYPSWYIVACK